MQHFIVGLPGPLIDWCADALQAALKADGRAAEVRRVASLQQCAVAALNSAADDLVFVAHAVDSDLSAALVAAPGRCVLVRSDPAAAFGWLLAPPDQAFATGFHPITPANSPISALRHVMASCATMTTLLDQGLSCQTPDQPSLAARDPIDGAGRIAARFGLPRGAAPTPPTFAAPDALPPEFALALRGFPGGFAGDDPVVLDASLFIDGHWPHAQVKGALDVTGRPRILFFGPYVCLSAGRWDCDVFFDLSEPALTGEYLFDVLGHRLDRIAELATLSFTLTAPGRQMARVSFTVVNHDTHIEFRMQTLRAMFDGLLRLDRVELRRRAPTAGIVEG